MGEVNGRGWNCLMEDTYRVVTLEEDPTLAKEMNTLHSIGWPAFMREDPVAARYWEELLADFSALQFMLFENRNPVACGNAISFHWDGTEQGLPLGWDDVFEQGMLARKNGIAPNAVSALSIVIHPDFQGKGLSERMVREMKTLIKAQQFQQMVAPVRPSFKTKYPLIPMEEYMLWKNHNGQVFDPWLRIHCHTGATIMKVAEQSMVISGTVQQWENWTGMVFPASGSYVISGALVPLIVNWEQDSGMYIEPNVWVKHRLD